ncbi:MAG: hybrid sensor histidine kinase/response regulator [Gammaproteobacteria bacterium]|nr:MAG: hybrid sensor histidine kinase/response regulator [Gammaproteobacteria bacterium]
MKHWGLRERAIFFSILPTLFVCLILGVFLLSHRFYELNTSLENYGKTLVTSYADILAASNDLDTDHPLIKKILQTILEEASVRAVNIYDQNNSLLLSAGPAIKKIEGQYNLLRSNAIETTTPTLYRTDESLRVTLPINQKTADNIINKGWLEIEFSTTDILILKYQTVIVVVMVLVLGLLVSSYLAFYLFKEIGAGIGSLRTAVEAISNGQHDIKIKDDSYGEFGDLQRALNQLNESIIKNQHELQQHVDQTTEDLRETLETIEIQNIELDLARKEALEASRIKSEFLANMSHEIRTPLNGIIGFTNLLLKGELSLAQKDYLETIQKSSESLLAIINDILDFSKIEAGKLTLDNVPLNLQDIVEDVLAMQAPLAYEKRLEQISLFYSDVPTYMMGDPLRLKQIITNLVNNSIKFTEYGEVVVRVMLDDLKDGYAFIKVAVSDTGVGLTADQQEDLFNAFRQADPTTARRFGGTGLGLTISKHLVEQMNGEINLESQEGKGSTFWFTFRASVRNSDDEQNPLIPGRQANILLYDSNPTVRAATSYTLSKKNIHVHEYDDITAVKHDLLNNEQSMNYDAAIIGINAQQPMYLEVSKIFKASQTRFPVIVFGNHSDQSVIADMVDNDMPPLITKPFNQKKAFKLLQQTISSEYNPKAPPSLTPSKSPQRTQQQLQTTTQEPPLQVIAVDDNAANLKLLCALLEDLGIAVTPCDSGGKCLELMEKLRFDLVLMDIQMPVMDGLETTQRIRAKETRDQHIPVIAVTAHALASEKRKLLNSGMDDYVTKPINEDLLIHIIKRWTGKNLASHPPLELPPCSEDKQTTVDIALGLKLANGKQDLAEEMLLMLFDSLKTDKHTMSEALKNNEYPQLLEMVHKLHGATRYTGVPRLQSAAKNLEVSLKSEQLEQVPQLADILFQEIEAVLLWGVEHRGIETT